MFSEVDNIVFPNSCEVIRIASQHHAFPIYKCGSSSLIESMQDHGWTFVDVKDISAISDPIKVFLRDPKERFLSGVNTYLQHLRQEFCEVDLNTALYFVNRYLFLNRHYAPQFFWLLNLARFSSSATQVIFLPMSDISNLTPRHSRAGISPPEANLVQAIEQFDKEKLELYFYLDQVLHDNIGQVWNLHSFLLQIKNTHPVLYNLIFQNTIDIVNVLPKT